MGTTPLARSALRYLDTEYFYRAMLAQSAVMRLHVVRPSVCLSVTFRYRDSSKIISRPNSLWPMRSLTPHVGDLVQWEHPQN